MVGNPESFEVLAPERAREEEQDREMETKKNGKEPYLRRSGGQRPAQHSGPRAPPPPPPKTWCLVML